MTDLESNAGHSLSPGARLPAELLVYILKLVRSPWNLRGVLKANHRLRSLALSTPELWSIIDFRCGTSWANFCGDRSGNLPVSVRACVDLESDLRSLGILFPRTSHLDMDIADTYTFQKLMPMLAEDWASQLESLILRWHARSGDFIGRGAWGSLLTRLDIHRGGIIWLPEFPRLRHVRFIWSSIALSRIHKLQVNSKDLETTEIKTQANMGYWLELLDLVDSGIMDTSPIFLPRFRSLKITTATGFADALLAVIPDPSTQLEVTIRDKENEQPEQISVRAAVPVLDRLSRYWQEKTGKESLPGGRIDSHNPSDGHGGWNCLVFGHTRSDDEDDSEPSLYFNCRLAVADPAPILDAVKTLRVDIGGANLGRDFVDREDLKAEFLPQLKTLVLLRAGIEDEEGQSGFESWLAARKENGILPFTLEVYECDESLQFLGYEWVGKGLLHDMVCLDETVDIE